MRCRRASGIFQCNAVFNCRIWRFVHLTIRPSRSRWPQGITQFRSPAAPNYRKLADSISSGSGITSLFFLPKGASLDADYMAILDAIHNLPLVVFQKEVAK